VKGASDLAVSNPAGPAAEVFSGFAALADGISDTFAFDLVFHLSKGGHNREQHGPHGCCSVHITSAQVQDAQARAPAAEFVREGKHVLGGSP
jgi:hypothetical protein